MYKTLDLTIHRVYSVNMSANYTLLGFLATEPNYGYELKKQYDLLFGRDKPILSGQVYSTLSRLKRDGKVKEIADASESGGPDRVKYAITPAGRRALEDWLSTPEAPSQHLQATMYMKTVLALMRDGDAAPYLDAQRHTHIDRMRQLTKQRRNSDLATTLLIDHAIYHIEADLRWIEMTSSRLTKLKEKLCL